MRSGILYLVAFGIAGSALLHANSAAAQPADAPAADAPATDAPATDAPAADAPAADATAADTAAPSGDAAAKSKASKQSEMVADAEAGGSPVELPGKTYRFVGLRYRGYIVPKFMENMFGADGGRTVYVNDIGPEFAIRKDGFEYVFSITYADYSMKPTPFKSTSDGEDAWEIIESKLKMIQLQADFLWSQEFSPEFSLNYGMGAGFGIVFGDLKRNQSYAPNGTASDPYGYVKCPAPGAPGTGNYCGTDNDHYGDYTEPSWANGGSKPIVFPLLMLETGLRFKPHKNFVGRLDLGFGTSGFLVGLGADYGL